MNPDTCVIVPTIREYHSVRKYCENARTHGFNLDRLFFLLVTEDFCDTDDMVAMLDDEGVAGAVFDETRRDDWFLDHDVKAYEHLIPKSSHAQTSFGLLYLWAFPEFDYGLFIDDDTLPHDDVDFFGTHLENLTHDGELASLSSDERWVNVLHETDALYPRGYPYGAMDETLATGREYVCSVVASQGLWTNVPDLDAVRILMDGDLEGQAQTRLTADDYSEDFVAAPGQYLTVCSMNLAFHRDVVPAFYQLPMDDNPWNVGRFDDIWSGVILKRAADVMGDQLYNGAPLCEHNKAPRSTFDDLANEAPGLELNEHIWEIVDDAGDDAGSYADIALAVGDRFAEGDWSAYENGAFLNHVGQYLIDWVDCLEELSPTTVEVPADD